MPTVSGQEGRELSVHENALLQLHIAEYQALTTRNTTWITLCYALWSILTVVLALLAQVYELLPAHLLVWSVVFAIDVAVLGFYGITVETGNNIIYLEQKLRRQVADIVGKEREFWSYETYLSRGRPVTVRVWEVPPLVMSIASCAAASAWAIRDGWTAIDTAALVAAIAFSVTAFMMLKAAVDARKRWEGEKDDLRQALVLDGRTSPQREGDEGPANPAPTADGQGRR